jgi:ketosteroid isomerase-like protein
MAATNDHQLRPISRGLTLALVLALAVCATALPAGQPRGLKHENRHEIEGIETAWRNAVLKGDTSVLEGLMADDYMAITSSGTLENKEQALANMRNGAVHFKSMVFSERKLRFYGTTALVTSRAEVSGKTADGDVSGNYRYTRVYVRDKEGKWKIVSFEASKIRDPDERK